MADNVLTITDENFETEVLSSDKPILVDFWAAWCGPCRMIAPIIDELADDYAGRFKIGKLNVDENQRTAAKYGVMSIPTLIIFKDGEAVETIIGVQPKEQLAKVIDKYL